MLWIMTCSETNDPLEHSVLENNIFFNGPSIFDIVIVDNVHKIFSFPLSIELSPNQKHTITFHPIDFVTQSEVSYYLTQIV